MNASHICVSEHTHTHRPAEAWKVRPWIIHEFMSMCGLQLQPVIQKCNICVCATLICVSNHHTGRNSSKEKKKCYFSRLKISFQILFTWLSEYTWPKTWCCVEKCNSKVQKQCVHRTYLLLELEMCMCVYMQGCASGCRVILKVVFGNRIQGEVCSQTSSGSRLPIYYSHTCTDT